MVPTSRRPTELRRLLRTAAGFALALAAAWPPAAGEATMSEPKAQPAATFRLALFNVRELSTAKLTAVGPDGAGLDPQVRAAAAIVQRVRPDVLVVQELDHDLSDPATPLETNARRFAAAYLAHAQAGGAAAVDYPYVFTAPVNTGVPSGFDLDGDGRVAGPAEAGTRGYGEDCWGYGAFPGQYAMAVLSRFPIRAEAARTFQRFAWRDLPGNHLPEGFYPEPVRSALRLSSKSHWDLPVEVAPGRRVHLWVSHPTPPAFDGPEDRNGRRNFDEIRFWKLYLDGSPALVDDAGRRGGRTGEEPFVVAGDLNASPDDRRSLYDGLAAIAQLLGDPRIQDPGARLGSSGARAFVAANAGERPAGDPAPEHPERATAMFLGGVRVDYLLPSRGVGVVAGGVFWPSAEEDPEGARLAAEASDHHLLWLDLEIP